METSWKSSPLRAGHLFMGTSSIIAVIHPMNCDLSSLALIWGAGSDALGLATSVAINLCSCVLCC